MSPYRAVFLGSSGAVGSLLLDELLASPACSEVQVVVRRPSARGAHPKIIPRVVDFERYLSSLSFNSEVAFCTMGVGEPSKVSKEQLWKVDVEFALAFARCCHASGVKHISLLTAAGADPKSRSHYFKVKGAVEEGFTALGFPRTSFFRPSVLLTPKARYGLKDRVLQSVFPRVSGMLPSKWRPVRIEDLARAMRVNAEQPAGAEAVEIFHYDDFVRLTSAQA